MEALGSAQFWRMRVAKLELVWHRQGLEYSQKRKWEQARQLKIFELLEDIHRVDGELEDLEERIDAEPALTPRGQAVLWLCADGVTKGKVDLLFYGPKDEFLGISAMEREELAERLCRIPSKEKPLDIQGAQVYEIWRFCGREIDSREMHVSKDVHLKELRESLSLIYSAQRRLRRLCGRALQKRWQRRGIDCWLVRNRVRAGKYPTSWKKRYLRLCEEIKSDTDEVRRDRGVLEWDLVNLGAGPAALWLCPEGVRGNQVELLFVDMRGKCLGVGKIPLKLLLKKLSRLPKESDPLQILGVKVVTLWSYQGHLNPPILRWLTTDEKLELLISQLHKRVQWKS